MCHIYIHIYISIYLSIYLSYTYIHTYTQVSSDVNLLPHERRRVWEAEAESLIERSAYHCARTVYEQLVKHYPTKKKVWMAASAHARPCSCEKQLVG